MASIDHMVETCPGGTRVAVFASGALPLYRPVEFRRNRGAVAPWGCNLASSHPTQELDACVFPGATRRRRDAHRESGCAQGVSPSLASSILAMLSHYTGDDWLKYNQVFSTHSGFLTVESTGIASRTPWNGGVNGRYRS